MVESCEYNLDNPQAGLSGVLAIDRSCETGVAAEKFSSPACATLIVVVPTARGVISPLAPSIVAVSAFEELYVSCRPESLLAPDINFGAKLRVPNAGKLMICSFFVSSIVFVVQALTCETPSTARYRALTSNDPVPESASNSFFEIEAFAKPLMGGTTSYSNPAVSTLVSEADKSLNCIDQLSNCMVPPFPKSATTKAQSPFQSNDPSLFVPIVLNPNELPPEREAGCQVPVNGVSLSAGEP